MTRYGLQGANSRELLTYGGRVLVHDNLHELEFLVPAGVRVVTVPSDIPEDQTLSIALHPELASVQWPLHRKDFRQ